MAVHSGQVRDKKCTRPARKHKTGFHIMSGKVVRIELARGIKIKEKGIKGR